MHKLDNEPSKEIGKFGANKKKYTPSDMHRIFNRKSVQTWKIISHKDYQYYQNRY